MYQQSKDYVYSPGCTHDAVGNACGSQKTLGLLYLAVMSQEAFGEEQRVIEQTISARNKHARVENLQSPWQMNLGELESYAKTKKIMDQDSKAIFSCHLSWYQKRIARLSFWDL